MTDDWTPKQLREELKNADYSDLPALEHAGLIDEDTLDLLLSMKHHHPRGEESQIFERILERAVSQRVRDSVEHGNAAAMAHAAGLSGKQTLDIGDWQQVEFLRDLFRDEPQVSDLENNVFQGVIFSSVIPPTGRGKTSFAYTLIEVAQSVHDDLDVVTNNPSDPFDDTPRQWVDLKKMMRANDGWTVLLLDEAAQFLQFADQTAGKSVSQMMKLLRHNQCHLIMVGHTGKDVPADIRRQMFFVDKRAEKKAVVGYGLTNSSSDDRMKVSEELITATNVPHTNVEYTSQGEETINIQFDGEDGADGEVEAVEHCSRDGCGAGSHQYPSIKTTGYCPAHSTDTSGDEAT